MYTYTYTYIYEINAYFTDADPGFDLGTPAAWTGKVLTPQTNRLQRPHNQQVSGSV